MRRNFVITRPATAPLEVRPTAKVAALAKQVGQIIGSSFAKRLGALRLLCEKRRLVCTGAPACGDGDIEQPEIDAELAAMLVPVAEEDVAEEEAARLREQFFLAGEEAPGFRHRGVAEFRQEVAHRGDAVAEGVQDFLGGGCVWGGRTIGGSHR